MPKVVADLQASAPHLRLVIQDGAHGHLTALLRSGDLDGVINVRLYEVAGDLLRLCIGPERPPEFTGAGPAARATRGSPTSAGCRGATSPGSPGRSR